MNIQHRVLNIRKIMDKNYLVQLTTNLYRLTLLFPKKEPLRYKMRELADEILADLLRITNQCEYTNTNLKKAEDGPLQISDFKKVEDGSLRILEDLGVLDGFFEVAKAQNWISPAELLKLQQEYSMLKENLERQNSSRPVVQSGKDLLLLDQKKGEDCENKSSFPPSANARVKERQQKILEILKEKEKAQVWEIKKFFPQVAKRTLRRDFESLLEEGAVERIGERNNTYYTRASQSRAKGGDEDLSSSTKLKIIEA